ncbi:MAG: serine protease, partial [Planctomycetota bacterium]|nr:serine protease [Planctomycetota bacterium]
EVEYSLSASPRATPGTWKMTMNATTTGGDAYSGVGRVRVSSNVIELAVGSPYVALKFKPGAVRRGQVTEIHCDVKHLQPFKQPARARLVGIPKGVSLVGGQYLLGPGDKKIVFKLRASEEALLGRYSQMRCELTFQEAGQSIRQLTENGVLRVDPAVKD